MYSGLLVLELSKLLIYESFFDKLQSYFGEKDIQNHWSDMDAFVLSLDANDIFEDL